MNASTVYAVFTLLPTISLSFDNQERALCLSYAEATQMLAPYSRIAILVYNVAALARGDIKGLTQATAYRRLHTTLEEVFHWRVSPSLALALATRRC